MKEQAGAAPPWKARTTLPTPTTAKEKYSYFEYPGYMVDTTSPFQRISMKAWASS